MTWKTRQRLREAWKISAYEMFRKTRNLTRGKYLSIFSTVYECIFLIEVQVDCFLVFKRPAKNEWHPSYKSFCNQSIFFLFPILRLLPNTSVTILNRIIDFLIRVQAQMILILYFCFFSNMKRHIMIKTYIIKTQSW